MSRLPTEILYHIAESQLDGAFINLNSIEESVNYFCTATSCVSASPLFESVVTRVVREHCAQARERYAAAVKEKANNSKVFNGTNVVQESWDGFRILKLHLGLQ